MQKSVKWKVVIFCFSTDGKDSARLKDSFNEQLDNALRKGENLDVIRCI